MKWFLRWFAINGIFAGSAWYGLLSGSTGFLNIAFVIAWVTILLTPMVFSDTFKQTLVKHYLNDEMVPIKIDLLFDLHMVILFAYIGWFVTPILYMVHAIALSSSKASVIIDIEEKTTF